MTLDSVARRSPASASAHERYPSSAGTGAGAPGEEETTTEATPAPAVALLVKAAGHKHAPGGLYERIFLGLELLWIALSAAHIAITQRPGRKPTLRSAQVVRRVR